MTRSLLGVASLLLGVASVGAVAAPATAATPLANPNWSGYVATSPTDTAVSYTSVTGTWFEPTVTCSYADAGASSMVWVGLGGFSAGSQELEQVGTKANCDAKGKPAYFAWFELQPYIAYNIKDKVSAGDAITASVNLLGQTLVELTVTNRTRHWTFTRKIASSSDDSSAEWIVEAPLNCVRLTCRQASLANFGSVTIQRIAASGNGLAGTLTDPAWTVVPLQLVPTTLTVPNLDPEVVSLQTGQANSPAGAMPGPTSADGSTFTLSWVRDARDSLPPAPG